MTHHTLVQIPGSSIHLREIFIFFFKKKHQCAHTRVWPDFGRSRGPGAQAAQASGVTSSRSGSAEQDPRRQVRGNGPSRLSVKVVTLKDNTNASLRSGSRFNPWSS